MNGNDRQAPELPQPQFKGVWICAEIWEHPDLTYAEKFLIAEIDSLSGKGKACFASNEFLAHRILQKVSHANNLLASLTTRGFLIRLHFDGRETKRCVHPDISSNPRAAKSLLKEYGIPEPTVKQPSSKSESSFQDSRGESKKQPSSEGETESSTIDTNREKTKTRARAERSPAKRHVRRGSREESSSLFACAGDEEGSDKTIQTITVASTPEAVPATQHASFTPEKEELASSNAPAKPNRTFSVVTSAPTEHDSPENVAEKFTEKYDLNDAQGAQIEQYIASQGLGYVMEKAELTDAEPRGNAGRYFMAALRDDFKPAKKTTNQKANVKVERIATEWHQPSRPALMTREQHASLADLKNRIRDGTPAI